MIYGRLNQVNGTTFGRVTNSDLLGTVPRPNNVNTAWGYEATRNLVSEVNNGAAGVLSYLNNAIGNRTSMTRDVETFNYTYNSRSEITGATSNTNTNYVYDYNYDPISNRLTANLAGTAYMLS